jgi:hypothetical protein
VAAARGSPRRASCLSSFFAGAARLGYLDAVKATSARLDELARAAEDHAARILERNDLVMQQMLQLLKDDDDEALRKREAQLHEVATAILLRLPHIGSITVKNAQGDVLMSTFFRRLRAPSPDPTGSCSPIARTTR